MKTPKFLSKLSAVLTPRPKKRLQATARAARRPADDYEEEEPTTKLSSAFIVVLILHVVAVGGIYAFNSITASRKEREAAIAPSVQNALAPLKTAQNETPKTAAPPAHAAATPAPHVVDAPAVPPVNVYTPKSGAQKTYTVKAGDNLTKIAFAYSVTSAEILQANHLKEGAVLRPGQTLTIPDAKTTTKPMAAADTHKTDAKPTVAADTHKTDTTPKQTDVPATATTPGFYTVKKGDTLTSIARNLGLTAEELAKANRNTDPKKLQPGQTLKVPPRKS